MRRDLVSALFLSIMILGIVLLAVSVESCRASLQVSTRVYECHQEVREGGSITLRDCRVTDDDQAEGAPSSDQRGDDNVKVEAEDQADDGAAIRAYVSPAAVAMVRATSKAAASDLAVARERAALDKRERRATKPRRRKHKARKTGSVHVQGYTRRRPARRGRRRAS